MTRILFYSIYAVVPVFITGIRIKENKCFFCISFSTFLVEKVHFFVLFYTNWEEIKSSKNEKSPGKVLEFCFRIFVLTLYYVLLSKGRGTYSAVFL